MGQGKAQKRCEERAAAGGGSERDSRWEVCLNLLAKEISEEGRTNGRAQLCRWSRCAFSCFPSSCFPSSSARARGPSKTSPPNCFSFARDYIYLERVQKQGDREGQFGDAEGLYTRAIDALPLDHLLLVLLLNNRILTRFKNRNPRGAIEDCTSVINLIRLTYVPSREEPVTNFEYGAGVDLRDGLVKAIKRCAKAWEGRGRWGTGERIGKWLLELDGRIVWGKKLFEVLRDVEGWLLLELPRRNPVGSHTTPWACGDLDVIAVRRDICVDYRLTFECSWL